MDSPKRQGISNEALEALAAGALDELKKKLPSGSQVVIMILEPANGSNQVTWSGSGPYLFWLLDVCREQMKARLFPKSSRSS